MIPASYEPTTWRLEPVETAIIVMLCVLIAPLYGLILWLMYKFNREDGMSIGKSLICAPLFLIAMVLLTPDDS